MADGNYRVRPESGRLTVRTARTGLGAKAGHDLTIEVTRWRGNVVIDTANPAASSVTVEADVDSFEVRQGTGGVKPLTDADRAGIKDTIRGKILKTGRYPTITFGSKQVGGTGESFSIDGDLTIVGVTQPVTVEGRLADGHARGSAGLLPSPGGNPPPTALLGGLQPPHRGEGGCGR